MTDQFICQPITPVPNTFDTHAMAQGEPGLPHRFLWQNHEYQVLEVLEIWKTSSPEGGSGEMYLRRHWWKLRTTEGPVMTIYCDRQARHARQPKKRWWLYTIESDIENH